LNNSQKRRKKDEGMLKKKELGQMESNLNQTIIITKKRTKSSLVGHMP